MQTKREQLQQIWTKTHTDYKTTIEGARLILILRNDRTVLVPLDELTDDEIKYLAPKQPTGE